VRCEFPDFCAPNLLPLGRAAVAGLSDRPLALYGIQSSTVGGTPEMADKDLLAILDDGVDVWNRWMDENSPVNPETLEMTPAKPDLKGAELSRRDLSNINLANATLTFANFSGANLTNSSLSETILVWANLTHADLRGANLINADLRNAFFEGADLTDAIFGNNLFDYTKLIDVKGLETCRHVMSSIIDHKTIEHSWPIPIPFLEKSGLPPDLISAFVSRAGRKLPSCFIGYSSKDVRFARILFETLRQRGVLCWFAPHDLPIGSNTWDAIDEAISCHDKLLLVLSKNSIRSGWVGMRF
jgi:Pentapeptide repeats (8 copies)/TIR domain